MEIIPYVGKYPSAAQMLINEGITSPARQKKAVLKWAEGIDITYTLKNMGPAAFKTYSDSLLLLAFQEATRYNQYRWKFARFEVRLGRLKKGRDLPEIASFQSAMHFDSEIFVYGPGYEVPQKYFLYNKVEDILDIAKRYQGKVNVQRPYKVTQLVISIREEIK